MRSRLLELLFVEAMRSATAGSMPPEFLWGLGDQREARTLKQPHKHINRARTVGQLAKIATLSRSSFFERFTRMVGVPPMEHLLS
ncbi:hypothetical protein [Parazoarcus communis]|uniref:HTH araC/xylS-type domain-containing protein n=1 Tax=Parazoarcus communis SWub3 = DSM 12120 TaxID=1121029 RepID=A0A323UPS0_9RHOO|nr:hypothetical protein [Parazoarcus communis]NMG72737.1 hypothetical protein [Parazoarcus communis SWub3 = DSM 12120]PZA14665.1 hypothetical protein DNK49_20425 [Azoarcus communis] [Parazoarcus communis SWub3 = DSM 12120]